MIHAKEQDFDRVKDIIKFGAISEFKNTNPPLPPGANPLLEDICEIEDSLVIARDKFPGQRNSLDALANRFEVTGYDRSFHGALLDANILADVYMMLTGGQSKFEFSENSTNLPGIEKNIANDLKLDNINLVRLKTSNDDIEKHESRLSEIANKHSIETIWSKH